MPITERRHHGPFHLANHRGAWTIADYLSYTLFMLLALNLDSGLAPDSACPRYEAQIERVTKCPPVRQLRPRAPRPGARQERPSALLIKDISR